MYVSSLLGGRGILGECSLEIKVSRTKWRKKPAHAVHGPGPLGGLGNRAFGLPAPISYPDTSDTWTHGKDRDAEADGQFRGATGPDGARHAVAAPKFRFDPVGRCRPLKALGRGESWLPPLPPWAFAAWPCQGGLPPPLGNPGGGALRSQRTAWSFLARDWRRSA